MRSQITKTIRDDDGDAHEYKVTLHGAVEGYKLGRRVLAVAAKCARIVEPIINSAKGANTVSEAADAMSGIGGDAIQDALSELVEGFSEELVNDLLKYVERDSKSAKQDFDKIYQGNYGELIAAVVFSLEANFGKMFKRLFTGKLNG